MVISEQIKALQEKVAAKVAEKNAFVLGKGVDATAEDVETAKKFVAEIAEMESKLAMLKEAEKSLAAQAVAVTTEAAAVTVTDKSNVTVKDNVPKGHLFTRWAMLQKAAKGNLALVPAMAEQHFKNDTALQTFVKSAVSAANSGTPAWAGSLIYPQEYLADFIELLYPQTVLGRLNLRKVPFNVTIAGMNQGTATGWVGEANPAPVTVAGFQRVYLTHTKIMALSVLSDEIIRFSNPAAEALVQADLLKSAAKGLDLSFLGAAAAVPNVSPAGMLNGVSGSASLGTTALSVTKDVEALLNTFIPLNYDMTQVVFVMTPALALQIGALRTTLGVKIYPNLDMNGGSLEGVPVITSNNATPGTITAFATNEIYLSEDAAPIIDFSKEASIIMDTAPASADIAGTTPAVPVQPVSMFQNDLEAIRIKQLISWQARRVTPVSAQITGCNYQTGT